MPEWMLIKEFVFGQKQYEGPSIDIIYTKSKHINILIFFLYFCSCHRLAVLLLATPLPMRKEKKETLYAEAFFISLLFISTIVVIHQVLYLLFLV